MRYQQQLLALNRRSFLAQHIQQVGLPPSTKLKDKSKQIFKYTPMQHHYFYVIVPEHSDAVSHLGKFHNNEEV